MKNVCEPLKALALFAGIALATGTVHATALYDNGAYNGQASAPNITAGNYATDTFTIGASSTVTSIEFVAWNFAATDTTTSVSWAIYSGSPQPYTAIPVLASGTAAVTNTFLLTNAKGYGVYSDTFAIPSLALSSGTYSLALYNAVASDPNDQVYWDANSGPSTAVIHTNFGPFEGYGPSESFMVNGSFTVAAVPEPETFALMGLGLAAIGFVSRMRKQR